MGSARAVSLGSEPEAGRHAYVAFFGDEHGEAHQAFKNYTHTNGAPGRAPAGEVRFEPLARFSKDQALAALLSDKADKAILPIADRNGMFDVEALDLLARLDGIGFEGEVAAQDKLCLAIPTLQYEEQVQSSFPGASSFARTEDYRRREYNQLSQAEEVAAARRIDVIYATAEDEEKCGLQLSQFRAAGVEVRRPSSERDIYRDVLKAARAEIDPSRRITTRFSEGDAPVVESSVKASAQNNKVFAAVLPFDLAHSNDFVCVRAGLEDKTPEAESRFAVVARARKDSSRKGPDTRPEWRKQTQRLLSLIQPGVRDRRNKDYAVPGARAWVKLDTRGPGVGDIGALLSELERRKIVYTPVYLHRHPETLPVVLQLDFADFAYDGRDAAIASVMRLIFQKAKANRPRSLGMYRVESLRPAKYWMGPGSRRLPSLGGAGSNAGLLTLLGFAAGVCVSWLVWVRPLVEGG